MDVILGDLPNINILETARTVSKLYIDELPEGLNQEELIRQFHTCMHTPIINIEPTYPPTFDGE